MVLYRIVNSRNSVGIAVLFSSTYLYSDTPQQLQPWRYCLFLTRTLSYPYQTTNGLSANSTPLPLPVGTTNTAGLDLTIGKRLEGTADDCGARTDCRTKNGPPLPQPGNNNSNHPKQQQALTPTTTTTTTPNNKPRNTKTPNKNPNKGSPTGQNTRTPGPPRLSEVPRRGRPLCEEKVQDLASCPISPGSQHGKTRAELAPESGLGVRS